MITQETKPVKTWGGFNLSLCEGKLLKDLTRDSHKPQYKQQSPYRSFEYKTLNRKNEAQDAL